MAGVRRMPFDIGLQGVASDVGEGALLFEGELSKGFVLLLLYRGEKRNWRDKFPGR
jgi:hypothetical protein